MTYEDIMRYNDRPAGDTLAWMRWMHSESFFKYKAAQQIKRIREADHAIITRHGRKMAMDAKMRMLDQLAYLRERAMGRNLPQLIVMGM